MAQQRKKPAEIEEEHEEIELEPTDSSEIDLVSEVDRVTDILGGRSGLLELRIYRIPKEGGMKRPYLTKMDPQDVNLLEDRLRDEYGTGEYEVRLWDGQQIHRRLRVEVEAPLKKESPQAHTQPADLSGVVERLFSGMSNMMREQQQETKIMMLEMADRLRPKEPEKQSMADMIAALVALDKLRGGNDKKDRDPLEVLERVLGTAEKVREFGAEQSDTLNPNKLINSLASIVQNAPRMPQPMTAPVRVPGPVHTPVAREPAKPISQPAEEQNDMFGLFTPVIRQQLEFLCAMAAKDADTEVYANVVLDQLPEKFHGTLLEKLQEKGMDGLIQICPNVTNFPEWFAQLIDNIIEMLSEGEADETGDLTDIEKPDIRTQTEPVPGSDAISVQASTEN
jgi:hypothetical protein